MAFDDILEPKKRSSEEFAKAVKPKMTPKAATKGGGSGLNSLLGNLDAADISKRLGLNEELTLLSFHCWLF